MTQMVLEREELETGLAGEKPPRGAVNLLVFDRLLQDPHIQRELQSTNLAIMPQGHLSGAAAEKLDVILAELNEVSQADRLLIEQAREVRGHDNPLLVIGVSSPNAVALARGRRNRLYTSRERRGGSPHRRLFDDFMTMPFESSRLMYLLDAWKLANSIRHRSGGCPAIDRNVVEALVKAGGPNLLAELIEPSVHTFRDSVTNIRQAVFNRDSVALQQAAHSLRSASGVFGAAGITDIAQFLERMGGAGLQEGATILADGLEVEISRLTNDLRNMAGSMAAGVFRGRHIVGYGIEKTLAEAIRTKIRSLEGTFSVASTDELREKPPGLGSDLLVISLGKEDINQLDGWRGYLEAMRPAPILIHARDSSSEWERIANSATGFIAPPAGLNEIVQSCHEFFLRPAVAAPQVTEEVAPIQGPTRLLVAEDEPLTAKFLIGILQSHGFEVTHAANGAEAITASQQGKFDAALLDLNMPEIDGYSVLSELRKAPCHHEIPVMILSGRSQERDIVKAFNLGADDYVTKPFNPPEVVLRLRKLLDRR